MEIIHVASESLPLVKTGGLADVVFGLARAQQKKHKVKVILPLYKQIKEKYEHKLVDFGYFFTCEKYVGLYGLKVDDLEFILIDNEEMFGSDQIYSYGNDTDRFAFYNWAVLDALGYLQLIPDVIHVHDWHTGLLPLLLKQYHMRDERYQGMKTIFTIHNFAFQGIANLDKRFEYRLEESGQYELDGNINFLKTAIACSDKITTVSPSYRDELLRDQTYPSLRNVLDLRSGDFVGVLNGIDYDYFDPKNDPLIKYNYNGRNYKKSKQLNKQYLYDQFDIDIDIDKPLICLISRLTEQKGLNLILEKLDAIVNLEVSLFILGSGDKHFEAQFENRFAHLNNCNIYIGYNEALAHQLYAASDFLLMPSLFEPCGLSQMIAMRYMTLPIVREVGGLKDSVEPYNKYTFEGNGFSFANPNGDDLYNTILNCLELYEDKKKLSVIIRNAYKTDYSFKQPYEQYLKLYEDAEFKAINN